MTWTFLLETLGAATHFLTHMFNWAWELAPPLPFKLIQDPAVFTDFFSPAYTHWFGSSFTSCFPRHPNFSYTQCHPAARDCLIMEMYASEPSSAYLNLQEVRIRAYRALRQHVQTERFNQFAQTIYVSTSELPLQLMTGLTQDAYFQDAHLVYTASLDAVDSIMRVAGETYVNGLQQIPQVLHAARQDYMAELAELVKLTSTTFTTAGGHPHSDATESAHLERAYRAVSNYAELQSEAAVLGYKLDQGYIAGVDRAIEMSYEATLQYSTDLLNLTRENSPSTLYDDASSFEVMEDFALMSEFKLSLKEEYSECILASPSEQVSIDFNYGALWEIYYDRYSCVALRETQGLVEFSTELAKIKRLESNAVATGLLLI